MVWSDGGVGDEVCGFLWVGRCVCVFGVCGCVVGVLSVCVCVLSVCVCVLSVCVCLFCRCVCVSVVGAVVVGCGVGCGGGGWWVLGWFYLLASLSP